MKIKYDLSIDNLTLVGYSYPQEIEKSLKYNSFVMNYWVTPNSMFQENFKMADGSFFQYERENRKSRYEFNPNVAKRHQKDTMSILKLMTDVHITRKDIAFDLYNINLYEFKVADMKSRKQVHYMDRSGNIETRYFGGKKSDEQIRLYDKGYEQKEDKALQWWRLEAQLREEKARLIDYNPFKDIVIHKDKLVKDYDVSTNAMIYYLKAYPEELNRLNKKTKKKYKDLMLATNDIFELDLVSVYERNKEILENEVRSWVNVTRMKIGYMITDLEEVKDVEL